MKIKTLCKKAHCHATEKGFRTEVADVSNIPGEIALMHSELSEALEEYRKTSDPIALRQDIFIGEEAKPEGFPSELADVVIRVADTCEHYGIDLTKAIKNKMAYNKTRAYKHGGKAI